MIRNENFRRGGKLKTAVVGLTTEGKTRCYIDHADPHPIGQKVRRFPKRLIIEFDESEGVGEAISIQTVWREALLSTTGKPIPGTGSERTMWSNENDRNGFFQAFQSVLFSIINGEERAIEGFNYHPVFSETGTKLPDPLDTVEPTYNYLTHNADGTPINPEPTV